MYIPSCQENITRFKNDNSSYRKSGIADPSVKMRILRSRSVSDLSSDCSVLKNNVSFLHLNVQSIVPKLDIITAEYSSYDILSFTESWLKPNINDETLKLPGYKFPPFRRDRQNKTGGAVIVYK